MENIQLFIVCHKSSSNNTIIRDEIDRDHVSKSCFISWNILDHSDSSEKEDGGTGSDVFDPTSVGVSMSGTDDTGSDDGDSQIWVDGFPLFLDDSFDGSLGKNVGVRERVDDLFFLLSKFLLTLAKEPLDHFFSVTLLTVDFLINVSSLVGVDVGGGDMEEVEDLFTFSGKFIHSESSQDIDLDSIIEWGIEINRGSRVNDNM